MCTSSMSDLNYAKKLCAKEKLIYKEVDWSLGPSLYICKNKGRTVNGIKVLPPTVILAPDDFGWCLIINYPDKVHRNITDINEAICIAKEQLEINRHT